jgi:peptidyl-prolyl cis-trans isomerase A (cyclophilin A)
VYAVRLSTSRGDIVIEVHRDFSPNDADRFYNLVQKGFYDDTRFYRVIQKFGVQFGVAADPEVNAAWSTAYVADDPVTEKNERGTVTLARKGFPNTAATQVWINTADNTRLDTMSYSPLGRVVSGMDVVDALYPGYGEVSPAGRGPSQERALREGNAYLDAQFPKLDRILSARIE